MKFREKLHKINQAWLNYQYKHTTIAIILLLLFIVFLDSAFVATLLGVLEELGYIGAFIAGLLSTSFFTTAPGVIILLNLAEVLDPFAMAVVAGAGAMVGDWLLLLFIENKIIKELMPLIKKLHIHEIVARLRYKYTVWILWLIGIVSLATPLPDEIGVSLLGISHFKPAYLLGIAFILNSFGFFVLVLAAKAFIF